MSHLANHLVNAVCRYPGGRLLGLDDGPNVGWLEDWLDVWLGGCKTSTEGGWHDGSELG